MLNNWLDARRYHRLSELEKLTFQRGMLGTIATHDLTKLEKTAGTVASLVNKGLLELSYPNQDCTDPHSLTNKGKRVLNGRYY